ncbi:substrate-binding domain-containing protein [Veronia pacifica]|uniref:HTH araC/xylS-type domain-containing protein n=1 Tax=Veronia pacifica TaxID=1080227 RepID=A0A1C3ER23_9GAMM|nr:substrate-binding domain-containing protein [Veronia pacifica]ODA35691.1 hypothetical protein A8L45_03505 [Veronia pacifica]
MTITARRVSLDTSKLLPNRLRLAVLLNPLISRQASIIRGINQYLLKENVDVEIIFGNEIVSEHQDIEDIWFDGIIADYSDSLQINTFERTSLPIVGVLEQSEAIEKKFSVMTVGINSKACIDMAVDCFVSAGIYYIGCYDVLDDASDPRYIGRMHAFNSLSEREDIQTSTFHGMLTNFRSWKQENQRLINWINSLPKPCGIVVINESRSKALLDACLEVGYLVPGEVSIITLKENNIDDFITRQKMTGIKMPLTEVGELACDMLIRKIRKERVKFKSGLISPSDIDFGETTQSNVELDPVVIQVNTYIRNNFRRGIKVQQVVDSIGFSRTLVEKKYKEKMGYSIHKALHDAKLDNAKHLLMTTDLSVSDIAKMSGYSAEEYLYRVFKAEVNMTPVDFRGRNKA